MALCFIRAQLWAFAFSFIWSSSGKWRLFRNTFETLRSSLKNVRTRICVGRQSSFFKQLFFFKKLVGTHSSIVYKQASEKIEQFTELFGYALLATGMTLTALPLCYAIVNFYVLGSGKESFFLFFPTWFVLYNQMMHLEVEREVQKFSRFIFAIFEVAIRLEDPIGVFGGMVRRIRRI